jgi:hypothetical protein
MALSNEESELMKEHSKYVWKEGKVVPDAHWLAPATPEATAVDGGGST